MEQGTETDEWGIRDRPKRWNMGHNQKMLEGRK